MSLLAPARGMPTLSAKDGISRPSLKPVPASSRTLRSMLSRHKGAKKLTQVAPSLRGLIEAFGTGTVHCSSHRKPLRLLAPPKTFPPAGVSRIPVAGQGFHSQRVALLFQFIQS